MRQIRAFAPRAGRLLVGLLLAAALASSAVAASPGRYDLLRTLRTQITAVKAKTSVPVLLPHYLPVAGRAVKAYPSGKATPAGWQLSLAGTPRCGGADACFLAQFNAQRGSRVPGRPNLRLPTGDRALYLPMSCGASCAPAELLFQHGGVLYTWQVKDAPRKAKAVLAQLAAEAIRAGPR